MGDNELCKNGKPKGQVDTFETLVQRCGYRNGRQIVKECRLLAKGCLEGDVVQRAILDALKNSSSIEKENLKMAHQVPFTNIEQQLDMQIRIKECTTKSGVKEQWFWSPPFDKPNACKNYKNAFK